MSESCKRFGDLLRYPLRSGVTVPRERRGKGIPMVNMGELFNFPYIHSVEMSRVDIDIADGDRYLLAPGDLLFARRSLKIEGAGKCSIVSNLEEPTTWESSIIRARLDADIADPRYFFYYFRSLYGRQAIGAIAEQVAVAGVRSSDLANLMIPVPSIYRQRAVVDILAALDDKIAVNDRIALTYEELLRARFVGLSCDTDDVEDAVQADEVIEFNPALRKPGGDAVYVDMASVPTSVARVSTWTRRPVGSGARFENGDTVMARITPCLENGKTGFIDFMADGEVGIGSTEYIVMRSRPGIPAHFSYFLARSPRFRQHAIANMVGSSGRQRCPVDVLRYFPLQRPDDAALREFGETASRAFAHMRSLDAESATLAELRDTLLPKLISGELRIKDAERVVEDAV